MVFANLTEEDKEAFFALLDEYFSSRPELAKALGLDLAAATGTSSPLQRDPAVAPKAPLRPPKPTAFASAAANQEIANAVGRVAAASRVFNVPATQSSSSTSDLRPPAPPRRTASSSSHDSSGPNGPLTQRRIGDIELPVAKNIPIGLRNKDAVTHVAAVAPALSKVAAAKGFGPPPVRRVAAPPAKREPTPEPELDPEPEEAAAGGEWAEALYDYNSADPNDLHLRENQRVLVTERTSDDWWTGEIDGKSGLFPATYVKLL